MAASFLKSTMFCPVCSTEREIPRPKFPALRALAISLSWAALCGSTMAVFFNASVGFWAAMVSGVLCFLGVEVYYGVKFKGEFTCPVCHFDPVLYRRSPDQAKQRCLESLKTREDLFLARWQAMKKVAKPRWTE